MELLVMIGAVVSAASAVPYIHGVTRGQVRPKLVSWLTWCLLAVLLTGAAMTAGQFSSAIMSGATVLTTGAVLLLALKKGNRRLDRLDIICLVGAIVGLIMWLLLDNSVVAILIAVAIDIVAFIPTLVHGWTDPEEESPVSYLMATSGASLGLSGALLAGSSLVGVAYPLYSTVFNGVMVLLLTYGRVTDLFTRLRDDTGIVTAD